MLYRHHLIIIMFTDIGLMIFRQYLWWLNIVLVICGLTHTT